MVNGDGQMHYGLDLQSKLCPILSLSNLVIRVVEYSSLLACVDIV
jgi:hypothetical protein